MKRSEMLKILQEVMDNSYDYCYDSGASYCYDSILGALEEAGMLPPSPEFDSDWDKSNDYTPVQQLNWEDE